MSSNVVVFVTDILNTDLNGIAVREGIEAVSVIYFVVRGLVLTGYGTRRGWRWLMGDHSSKPEPVKVLMSEVGVIPPQGGTGAVPGMVPVYGPGTTACEAHQGKAGKLPEFLKEAAPLHMDDDQSDDPAEDTEPMTYAAQQAMIALTQSEFTYDEGKHILLSGGLLVQFSDDTLTAMVVQIRAHTPVGQTHAPTLKDLVPQDEYILVCAHAADLKNEAQRLDLQRRNHEAGAEIRRARLESSDSRRPVRADVVDRTLNKTINTLNNGRRGPVPTIVAGKVSK